MAQNPLPKLSLQEALDNYKHIKLTEEELQLAILTAKQKKEQLLKKQELDKRVEENRKKYIQTQWSYEQTRGYLLYRAKEIFRGKPFLLDGDNTFIFDLLCYYFSNDSQFESIAVSIGIKTPSLNKGLMLAGNFGVGKTWLMRLFQKNQRQVYHLQNAKDIADNYEENGEEFMLSYENKIKNASNDVTVFYQPYSGLCIDDLGTEDIKNHYGNKKNVIGDLIEKRYSKGSIGVFLHATTNLTAEQLKDFYGGRVVSRMREIFNFIELPGEDRRA